MSRRRWYVLDVSTVPDLPDSPPCRAAVSVAGAYCSAALFDHSVRSAGRGVPGLFRDQALRKPASRAGQLAEGLARRLAGHPFEPAGPPGSGEDA